MFRRSIILLLALVLLLSFATTSFASSLCDTWQLTDVRYGNTVGDVTTATGIASLLSLGVGFGPVAAFTTIAGGILSIFGDYFTVYYKKEYFFSPDGYAYIERVTYYQYPNYTGQIGSPVCSDIIYISASVQE